MLAESATMRNFSSLSRNSSSVRLRSVMSDRHVEKQVPAALDIADIAVVTRHPRPPIAPKTLR